MAFVMLELDYGVPGSGKSYKAVNTIYQAFVNEKSDTFNKYQRFYCNIAEFKFDSFNGQGLKLVAPDFISQVAQLRIIALRGGSEDEILELARSFDLLDCLIVWDEAQSFFSKKNDVLLWLVEYHRHLHQDIILIAQSPDRILPGYKDLGDLHYKAVPPSLRVTNSLQYKRFATPQLFKKSVVDTLSLKPDPKIFALYKSGANEKPKKIIYKFVIIAIVIAFFVSGIFYFISNRFSGDNNVSQPSVSSLPAVSSSSVVTADSITVACVGFDCSYMGSTVPIAVINQYEHDHNFLPSLVSQLSPNVFLRSYPNNNDFIKGVFNVSVSLPPSS